MAENLTNALRETLPPELVVFIISLLPILELRGGLIAAALLGIPWAVAFPICVIGNMLPIPFILLFLKRIFALLKKTKTFHGMIVKLEEKANKKSGKLDKFKLLGLLLFVGIPLPGTGAWTGALIADAVNMRIKQSLPVIFLGVICAGLVISFISYVIPGWL